MKKRLILLLIIFIFSVLALTKCSSKEMKMLPGNEEIIAVKRSN